MFPIFSNLATAYSFILFIIVMFTGDWRRCPYQSVWALSYVSWFYFGLNVLTSFLGRAEGSGFPDFSPLLQFFYLPFLFLALAVNLPTLDIKK